MSGKKIRKCFCEIAASFFLLMPGFILSGCDDLTVDTTISGDVNGTLYGFNNAFLSGYKVTVAGTTVITDNYGRFSFKSVEYPYDLVIFDSIGRKCAFYPKRDSFTRENLSIGILSSSYNMIQGLLTVTYPPGTVTGRGKLLFTDNADKNLYGTLDSAGGQIEFDMSFGTQYSGKIIALTYSTDNTGRIISYDKYCVKDGIILNAGVNQNLTLSPQDFRINYVNKSYRLAFNMLPGQNADIRYAYISFGNKYTHNYINNTAFEIFNSNILDIVVPGGIGIQCYPIVGLNTKQNESAVSFSSVYCTASGDVTVAPPQAPVLVSPPENAFIDVNTEFVFNQGLSHVENRFYKLNFFNVSDAPVKCLYYDVYLDKERFSLSELDKLGIDIVKGRSFRWSVEVYENISLNDNIKEFLPCNNKFMTECVKRKVTVNP